MNDNGARRPGSRGVRRWAWLLAAVLLLAAAIYFFGLGHRDPFADDYPELAAADPAACAAIRKAWSKAGSDWPADWDAPDRDTVENALQASGDRGPLALLRVLMEKAPKSASSFHKAPACWDADSEPWGIWLRDHAPTRLDPLMLRILDDRDLYLEMRRKAVAALCRPQSSACLEPLAKLALDATQHESLRLDVIQRLPRMNVPLLAHLRPLLYQPFHGLDRETALTLALAGEPEAPTLLLEMIDHLHRLSGTGKVLAEAIIKRTGDDPAVTAVARRFARFHDRWMVRCPGDPKAKARAAGRALAAAFREWLRKNPEARDTRFECERAAYLASSRRRREVAIDSLEAIVSCDDAELDLGAAALWCGDQEATPRARRFRHRNLERLHRLSLWLKEEIGDRKEPEAIIRAITARLFPEGNRVRAWNWEGGPPSTLQLVLRLHEGNCLGNSLLLLAMGERLGLPIHGVRAPNHVFVRWDDGKVRRNIETTDSGAMHTDAEIRAAVKGKRRITEADVKAGRYLANLSKKSVIASLLCNLAGVYLDSPNLQPGPWRFEKARALADQSLRLDPSSPLALLCRGRARIELGDDEEAALADLEAALRLDDESVRTRNVMASLLLRMGRREEALARFEKSLAVRAESRDARLGMVRCLLALDRPREALNAAEELNRRVPNDRQIQRVRLTALIRQRDSRWRHVMETLSDSPSSKPCTVIDCGLYLNVAALLLQREKGHPPDATSALEILSRIPDHGLEAPKGTESRINSVLRKARDGKTNILIRKKALRSIQRGRDELRERAKSILESRPTHAK